MKKLIYILVSILVIGSLQSAVPAAAPVASAKASKATGELKAEKLSFAYADESGKRLLGFEKKNPKRYVQAVTAPGKILPIKFNKHQKRNEQSTDRQNHYNFDKDQGELFTVIKGSVPGDESVLLAEKDAFQGHEFLSYKPSGKGKLTKDVIRNIEKAKKRKAVSHEVIGQAGNGVTIGLVVFEKKKGQKPLASLVVASKSGLLFEDFPGNDDLQSTWRVDDGGEIDASMFKVLFVTKSKVGYALAYEWFGFEGCSLNVIQQQGGKFRDILSNYRYTAPL